MNWINVNDESPKNEQEVLIFISNSVEKAEYLESAEGYVYFIPHHPHEVGYLKKNITHWMPLPEGPNGSNTGPGSVWQCSKDLYMKNTDDRVFVKGNEYPQVADSDFCLIDEDGNRHSIDGDWLKCFTVIDN